MITKEQILQILDDNSTIEEGNRRLIYDFNYNDLASEIEKQCNIDSVSQQLELLIAYEKGHYTQQEWILVKDQCIKEINIHLEINCG